MDLDLTLCNIGLADTADVARFLQLAYIDTYSGRHGILAEMFDNDAFLKRTEHGLRSQLEEGDEFVLGLRNHDTRVVATIGVRRDSTDASSAEIWGFYLDPVLQRRGYGAALWRALMSDPRTLSYANLYLYVVVGSQRAIAFYEARGFHIQSGEGTWHWPPWDPPNHTPYLTMRRRNDVEPPCAMKRTPAHRASFPGSHRSQRLGEVEI